LDHLNGVSVWIKKHAQGVSVCVVLALAAGFLSEHYGAPVMLFALLLGMAFHFLTEDETCAPGVEFCSKTVLRMGVALLGARVSIDQLMSLGALPLIMTPVLVALTIGAGVVLARLFGRSTQFGLLIGGAVAICGASAALAIAAVLPKTEKTERDTLFAVVAVTTLSTVAMIGYPLLFTALHSDDAQIGFLIGATIHDVAQVVGAGYAVSDEAGDVAVFVKLLRVAMLPLVVMAFVVFGPKGEGKGSPLPWFAVAFAVIMTINSFHLIPAAVTEIANQSSRWMLIIAISALGVKTSLKSLASLGAKHMAVVVLVTAFLLVAAIGGLGLAAQLYQSPPT
jgi:uncharacterized integral membrane protein (TIGR00698 family)